MREQLAKADESMDWPATVVKLYAVFTSTIHHPFLGADFVSISVGCDMSREELALFRVLVSRLYHGKVQVRQFDDGMTRSKQDQ
jgi:hypothetical protein